MSKWQQQVEKFHRAFNLPVGESVAIRSPELRTRLIREESEETCAALADGDIIGVIDGLCDTIFVCLGTAVEMGIDLEPFWDEVCRSNVAKVGGKLDATGKLQKPAGWTPPDIARVLAEQRERETTDAPGPRCRLDKGDTVKTDEELARKWLAYYDNVPADEVDAEGLAALLQQVRESERAARLQDCYSEYSDDGIAQKVAARIAARKVAGAPSGDGEEA